jgi:hypothetical protein
MAKQQEISLLPNQVALYEELLHGKCPVVGIGGGRGSAKSSGLDRVLIALMYENPGLVCCLVMRTWVQQVVAFHLEAISRDFPKLAYEYLKTSPPATLKLPNGSRLEFKYASDYKSVEENFRSGNYSCVCIDQSEQFTFKEIEEIRNSCRVPWGKKKQQAKLILSFNMRGSSIQDHRKMFYLHDVPNPGDYTFTRWNPWDNYTWVQTALEEDKYTVQDYYSWTDDQRKKYSAERGPYTKQLASKDPVIAKADWEGCWDSLEGMYFANSWDLEAVQLPVYKVEAMRKPWATHWLSMDWGKTHYSAVYWNYRVTLNPSEAHEYLGWTLQKSINVTTTYRELIISEKTSSEIGRLIVESTPVVERPKHKNFFLSPECCTDDPNCIGQQIGKETRPMGMPHPSKADNDRKGGAALMDKLLKGTKFHGLDAELQDQVDDVWFISSECSELLKTIPVLMRNPKDLDDVFKSDLGITQMEDDCYDACFVAGTTVMTDHGQVPIEQVASSMRVMTRKGWRRVLHAWKTREGAKVVTAVLSDGRRITCTPNHRFATNRGFSPLDSIRYGEKLITWNQNLSSSTERNTNSTIPVVTIQDLSGTHCTVMSGNSIEDQFLPNFMFTTKTTHQSGLLILMNSIVYPVKIIGKQTRKLISEVCLHGLKQCWKVLESGIVLQTAGLGIPKRLETSPLVPYEFQNYASNVTKSFKEHILNCSAPPIVSLSGEGRTVWTTLRGFVQSVVKPFFMTSMTQSPIAVDNVVRLVELQEAGFADVYDLEIEDEHEFFVNGVLVHNCRYGLKSMLNPRKKSDDDKLREKLDGASPQEKMILTYVAAKKKENHKAKRQVLPPSWRGNIK